MKQLSEVHPFKDNNLKYIPCNGYVDVSNIDRVRLTIFSDTPIELNICCSVDGFIDVYNENIQLGPREWYTNDIKIKFNYIRYRINKTNIATNNMFILSTRVISYVSHIDEDKIKYLIPQIKSLMKLDEKPKTKEEEKEEEKEEKEEKEDTPRKRLFDKLKASRGGNNNNGSPSLPAIILKNQLMVGGGINQIKTIPVPSVIEDGERYNLVYSKSFGVQWELI
jgi:hypothetical protein